MAASGEAMAEPMDVVTLGEAEAAFRFWADRVDKGHRSRHPLTRRPADF